MSKPPLRAGILAACIAELDDTDFDKLQSSLEDRGISLIKHGSGGSVSAPKHHHSSSKVWFKAITAYDDSHENGYCLAGDFVPADKMLEYKHSRLWVAVAQGYPQPTIMFGSPADGATSKFRYPSGADGELKNFRVIKACTSWKEAHAFMRGVIPTTKIDPSSILREKKKGRKK